MMKIAAVAAAASISVGAAQAATYQYDFTMDLTRLTLDNGFITGTGEIPGFLAGESCVSHSGDEYECSNVDLDARPYRDQVDYLSQFPDSFSGSLTLEATTEGSRFSLDGPEAFESSFEYLENRIQRIGKALPGRLVPGEPSYFAGDSGFYIDFSNSSNLEQISSRGYDVIAELSSTFVEVNEDLLYNTTAGATIRYTTTSLNITEIAPVPLPASLPLLGLGIGAIAYIRARKAR